MSEFIENEDDRKAFGHTVFCDDIRQELGGKVSFIGAYSGTLIVHTPFPIALPRFGLAVTYFEKHGACSGPVSLRIYFPGDESTSPSIDAELPIEEIRKQALAAKQEAGLPPSRFIRLDTQMVLNALVLKSIGVIRVRAVSTNETVRLGALRITQQLPPTAPQNETKPQT
jgi:hypothetical protein